MMHSEPDQFRNRGAVEQNSPGQPSNLNVEGQIGHRNKGPLVDSLDTDFPEPGENPEHSGEAFMVENKESFGGGIRFPQSPDPEIVDQDPGQRQKENQNEDKDDPLAA